MRRVARSRMRVKICWVLNNCGIDADEYVENVEEINKKIDLDNKLKQKEDKKTKKTKMTFL